MYWNHRIVIKDDHYELCEVYYDENGEPMLYGDATAEGESVDEVKEAYSMMKSALKREPLHFPKDFTGSFDRE